MKRLHITIILFVFTVPFMLYAAGAKEEAAPPRGEYIVERGDFEK